MKKTTLTIALALLCLFFRSSAQTPGLKIGDKVPDALISGLFNYPTTTARLSDFRGQLLILDFWATWCAPCVAMIPKMDSLQKAFGDKVRFISVSSQSRKEIQTFLARLEKQQHQIYNLPEATGDTLLRQLFPSSFLPHYVWITPGGTVAAITEPAAVSAANISALLDQTASQPAPQLTEKKDIPFIPYDIDKPFLLDHNGGDGHDLIYHAVLTPYNPGLPLQRTIKREANGGEKVLCKNQNILQLFAIAYSTGGRHFDFNLDQVVMQVSDTSRLTSGAIGAAYLDWLSAGNGYCYELIVPPAARPQVLTFMQQDLGRLFPQYLPVIEQRPRPCLVLTRTGTRDLLQSRGGASALTVDRFGTSVTNAYLAQWVTRANVRHYYGPDLIDETGYRAKIDLRLGYYTTLARLNRELAAHGLQVTPETRPTDVLVIHDRKL